MKKICQNPNCNKEFETTSKQTKYCCDKCAKFMHKYGKEIIKYKDKCCEICGKEHDHTYGSGRFCSKECKIEFIANKARNAHNPKVKAHLDKLRKEGKIVSRKPYGTWTCRICGKILTTRKILSEHICQKHFNIPSISNSIHEENGKFKCPCCEKEYENYRQVIGHMTSCPKHPLKRMHDEAHKASGRTYSKHYSEGTISFTKQSRKHTKETKEKISAIRTELISKGIGLGGRKAKTYKLPNIKGDMFFHQGTWELNVAKQMNSLGILWVRNKRIPYIKDGVRHYYIPDYFIPEKDSYVEVKGYFDDAGKEKMRLVLEQNPGIRIYFIYNEYKSFINGKIPLNENLILTLDKIK